MAPQKSNTLKKSIKISMEEMDKRQEQLEAAFPEATSSECTRFLVARDGSLEGATQQLKSYMDWRQKYEIDKDVVDRTDDHAIWTYAAKKATAHDCELSVDLPRVVRTYQRSDGKEVTVLDGTVAIQVIPAQIDISIAPASTYALAMAFYVNQKIDRNSMDKFTVCLDVRAGTGWPNESAYSLLPFIKTVSNSLNTDFPETLKTLLLYPMPSIALYVWEAAKLFLDPDTASKIILLKGSANEDSPVPEKKMLKYMDKETLEIFENGRKAAFKEKPKKKKKGLFR